MDSSSNIGGASWKNLGPLSGTPAPRQQAATPQAESQVSAPGDRAEISAQPTISAELPQVAGEAPQAQAPRAEFTPSSVPLTLMDDGLSSIGLSSSSASAHPTSGLGVLAQLDETSGVRAINDGSGNNRFGDLHLVGVSNAAQFLGNPNAMYLGI